MRMSTCMYVCMCACMHVCPHVCMYVHMSACMYACMCVCMHVCACACVCVYICMFTVACILLVGAFSPGHIGIVKDCTEDTARVELHTNCKTISVDKNRLSSLTYVCLHFSHSSIRLIVQSSTRLPNYFFFHSGAKLGNASIRSDSGRTPMHAGSATPMHGSQTPMYGGGKTPMYGSQTPLHDGSRTPHYGSQTPLHEGGLSSSSRTPGSSSAWDPNNANTPARCAENIRVDQVNVVLSGVVLSLLFRSRIF